MEKNNTTNLLIYGPNEEIHKILFQVRNFKRYHLKEGMKRKLPFK